MSAAKKAAVATRVATDSALATRVAKPLDLSKALRAYLDEVGRPSAAGIASLDDAEQVLRQHMDSEAASRVMQGWVLASVHAMGVESLRELATRVAMNRETMRQRVDYFRLFQEAPDLQSVRTCAHLEFSIAREVAKWPREDQLAFIGGKPVRGITAAEARSLTAREFVQATRDPDLVKASKKIATLEADKEGLQAEVKELKGALKHRYEVLKMPDFAAHARQESVALSEQMMASVTALEELLTDQLASKEAMHTFPDWRDRAAGTMYHSIRAAHARTQALLARMEEEFGEHVTGKIDYEHTLSDGELLIAKEALDVILKRHKTDAENREAKRQNEKGGKGRPRKIKATD